MLAQTSAFASPLYGCPWLLDAYRGELLMHVSKQRALLNFLYSSLLKESTSTSADKDSQAEVQISPETSELGPPHQDHGAGSDPCLSPADSEAQTTDDQKESASLTVVKLSILLK